MIVISPLIALMQDQVAQLAQMGIPAAVLNSTLSDAEQSARNSQARAKGGTGCCIVSPERLARADTLEWLAARTDFFFRDRRSALHLGMGPRISSGIPAAEPTARAFSGSSDRGVHGERHAGACGTTSSTSSNCATPRQIHRELSTGRTCATSCKECDAQTQPDLLLRALRNHAGSNVIVYAPTIARVEATVDFLEEQRHPGDRVSRPDGRRGREGATRSGGCRMKCACWSARSPLDWGSTRRRCAR